MAIDDPKIELAPLPPRRGLVARALHRLGVRRVAPRLELATEYQIPNEAEITTDMIAELTTAIAHREPPGTPPRRGVHPKLTGCVEAEFTVPEDLPPELRVGLFARPGAYPALLRFSNTSPFPKSDGEVDIRGVAIKLRGIGASTLLGDQDHDFVLASAPALATRDARDFLDLIKAELHSHAAWFFFRPRLFRLQKLITLLKTPRQKFATPADYRYWSATPYLFGPGQAVKYSLVPRHEPGDSLSDKQAEDHLLRDLEYQLAGTELSFDFMVQQQIDPEAMPIEDISIEWDEERSPFVRVATIRVSKQAVADEAKLAACERASFHPWRCLPEHRPLGSVNRARRRVYDELAAVRLAKLDAMSRSSQEK